MKAEGQKFLSSCRLHPSCLRHRRSGFTLMELILVMLIALTAVAMASSSLRGWSRGAQLRNAGDEFLTLTRYARTKAISDAIPYRIEFQSNQGTYQLKSRVILNQLTEEQAWQEVPSTLGQIHRIPEGGTMELTVQTSTRKQQGDNLESIDFYPNGRTEAALVRISDGLGFEVQLKCDVPSDDFYLAYEGATNLRP